METLAQKTLAILEPIPDNEFILYSLTNHINKWCGLGHLNRLTSKNQTSYSLDNCSTKSNFVDEVNMLFINYFRKEYGVSVEVYISNVNDNTGLIKVPGDTAKEHIIGVLKQMINKGY